MATEAMATEAMATDAMASVAMVLTLVPLNNAHRHSDILMEVPLLRKSGLAPTRMKL